MKKLMFTAAVAAAMGAFAIESANTVGYTDVTNAVSGYCQRGAPFIAVGSATDSYSIQSIVPQKPTNAATELGDGGAVIQQIDDYGEVIASYLYFLEGSPETSGGAAGWYQFVSGTGYVYADVTFSRGEGFLYQAPYFEDAGGDEVGSYFKVAGEVNVAPKSVYSDVSGYCHRANYRFANLSIQKLTPKGTAQAATELGDGGAVIQEIDDYGEVIASYLYFLEGSPETSGGAAGWYSFESGTGYVYATKTFTPGEGFLYQAPYFEDAGGDEIGSYLEFDD